jgi:hypothetical protein
MSSRVRLEFSRAFSIGTITLAKMSDALSSKSDLYKTVLRLILSIKSGTLTSANLLADKTSLTFTD